MARRAEKPRPRAPRIAAPVVAPEVVLQPGREDADARRKLVEIVRRVLARTEKR